MTQPEIRQKIERIKMSEAPFEEKQEAIQKLEKKLVNKHDGIKKDIEAGRADIDDINSSE